MKSYAASVEPKTIEYLLKTFRPEDPILKEIRERSDQAGLPPIQVGEMDALHLEILARAFNARKIVEIGTLGGYSGVALARAVPPDGKLYTFEYEPKHADVARESFRKAGLENKVEIFTGPALENLPKINLSGPFDLVFIDADKENYPSYLQWAAENLRIGGTVLADNSLGWGMIADDKFESADDEKAVRGIQQFNALAARDQRFRATLLPTGEGLTVIVKVKWGFVFPLGGKAGVFWDLAAGAGSGFWVGFWFFCWRGVGPRLFFFVGFVEVQGVMVAEFILAEWVFL
jgi:caffeoyl-CoA O-methyltransferase